MKIYNGFNFLNFKQKSVVTIGMFDGVHIGHQKLIKKTVELSKKNGFIPVLITFNLNPKQVFNKKIHSQNRILPKEKKYELIYSLGIKKIVELNFNSELYSLTAEKFISELLIKKINTVCVVIGYDFKFGAYRKGDINLLKHFFQTKNVFEIKQVSSNNEIISSTYIKQLLLSNEFKKANKMLGYNFFLEGKIQKGKQLGSKIGFPTMNIPYNNEIIKLNGIFSTDVLLESKIYQGISHIGTIPTFKQKNYVIETFLPNFNKNVYNKTIQIIPKKFIRKIIKFKSIDELKKQIIIDIKKI